MECIEYCDQCLGMLVWTGKTYYCPKCGEEEDDVYEVEVDDRGEDKHE